MKSCQLSISRANKGLQDGMIFDMDKPYYCLLFATHHRASHLAGYAEKIGFNGLFVSFQHKTLAADLQKRQKKANGTALNHR